MTDQPSSLRALANRPVSERTILFGGLALGVVLRIVQIATSIGSVDAYFWTKHVELTEKFGVLRVYHAARVINHPPFGLEVARWTGRLGKLFGLHFFDSFRILQGVADVIAVWALFRLARRLSHASPIWVGLAYFLSPAAIFISAFHCNSDPMMVMFIILAILAVVEERPILGGVLIGLATGIKIIALPALPLLLLGCRGKKARIQFLIASAVVGAVIFLPAIFVSGAVVIRNIFGYTGWRGGWGLPLAIDLVVSAIAGSISGDPARFVTPLLILSMLALWGAEGVRALRHHGWLDPHRLPRTIGLAFLLVLFLGPGFGVQYLIWILPCLPFLFARRSVLVLHAIVSTFVFWLYTSWAQEWPWVYADGGANTPYVGMFGLVVWLAIGWAAFNGARMLYARHEPPGAA